MKKFNEVVLDFSRTTQAGNVRFNDETSAFYLKTPSGYEYDVDLKRCQNAAQALDWIHQIHGKTWGRPMIGDFLEVMFENTPCTWWSGKA